MSWQTDEAIAVMDLSGRFIALNAGALAATGRGEDEVIGRTPQELFGEVGEAVAREMEAVLSGQAVVKTFDPQGEGELSQAILKPWRDDAGEIAGILSRFSVKADRRNSLQGRERRLRLAMDMAKVMAYEIDFRTGLFTSEPPRPPGPERYYCYEDTLSTLPEADRAPQREAWKRHLATGEVIIGEAKRLMPDGETVWHVTHSEALRNVRNEVIGVAGVTQVIDDRKKIELALLAEKDAAQAANRSKSEFLANMSHEIRTPLNGVLGLASLLRQTQLDPAQSEMVRTIETSAHTLNALLSDVLDLAKIESGRLELDVQPFEPAGVVGHIHHLFSGAAAAKGLGFTCDIDPGLGGLALGDRTRLSQILTNLTSNAIKFTAAGDVSIRAWASGEGREQRLCFAVADTGVGISGEASSRLFQRFVQADGSIGRSFGGTGLGLAISRTLARMMGGDVEVVSEPGQGSTFTLTIRAPRCDQSEGEATTEDAATPALPTERLARMLLVEDHPVNRRVVELILGDLVALECAENGALGLAAFKQRPFDVVLMDKQMPVMDGLEATRAIRAFERAQGAAPTPIIMLSANALSEHVRMSLDAGADRHLAKPITAHGLVQAVARAVAAKAEAEAPARANAG